MKFDKVQTLRNILKKLNRDGWEMPYTVQQIDSLDESQLKKYFLDNVSTAGIMEDSVETPYALVTNRTPILTDNRWENFSDRYFEKLIDGAIFFAKNNPNKKGVRVDSVNGELTLSSVSDVDKALNESKDICDLRGRIKKEQDLFDQAAEYINTTPKPAKPGFFARLFNWQSNKDYKAYQTQQKIYDAATDRIKSLENMLASLTPHLEKAEPLGKEREFAEAQPERIAKAPPVTITKTLVSEKEADIPEEDFDFGDGPDEEELDEKLPYVDFNGDIIMDSVTDSDFEMKPAEMESRPEDFFERKPSVIEEDDEDLLVQFKKAKLQEQRDKEIERQNAERMRALEEKAKQLSETRDRFFENDGIIHEQIEEARKVFSGLPAFEEFAKDAKECIDSIRNYYYAQDRRIANPDYKVAPETYVKLIASAKILNEVRQEYETIKDFVDENGYVPHDSFTNKMLNKDEYKERFDYYCNDPSVKHVAGKISENIDAISGFIKDSDYAIENLEIKAPEEKLNKEVSGPMI